MSKKKGFKQKTTKQNEVKQEHQYLPIFDPTLPCKYCGGESETVKGSEFSSSWIVRCKKCGKFIEYKNAFYDPENKRQAILIWNEKNKPDRNTSDLKIARKAKWGL